jgi:hypothetical protein
MSPGFGTPMRSFIYLIVFDDCFNILICLNKLVVLNMSMDFFVPSRACYSFVNVIDESCLSYVEAGDLAQAYPLNVFQLALIVN